MKKQNKFKLIAFIIFSIAVSCEDSCEKITNDMRSLTQYTEVTNKCDKSHGANFHEYYIDSSLFMSGSGDRFRKKGQWTYFKDEEIKAKGEFINNEPIGIWKYDDFKSVRWSIFHDSLNGYKISTPSIFKRIDSSDYSFLASIDEDHVSNINVNVFVSNYDVSLKKIIEEQNIEFNNNTNISNLKAKAILIDGKFDEVYQRSFNIDREENTYYTFQSIYGIKERNIVFIFSFNCQLSSFDRWIYVLEPMLSSLKFSFAE